LAFQCQYTLSKLCMLQAKKSHVMAVPRPVDHGCYSVYAVPKVPVFKLCLSAEMLNRLSCVTVNSSWMELNGSTDIADGF